ncbi:MAG: M20/M25/M40 family metallo-hydrolase [Candidatus Aminicenantales bacterium]
MSSRRRLAFSAVVVLALAALSGAATPVRQAPEDPVLKKILEIGLRDNRVMTWLDIAANRFGGRLTGSDAYANASAWALWQFKQWGVEASLDEAGEVPVGFNRGPWFGRMIKPAEKTLHFGTPAMTSGTKGAERGPVVIGPFKEKEEEALQEVEALKDRLKGAWVLIPGESNGVARDGRHHSAMSAVTKKMAEAGALGTIQMSREPIRILNGEVDSWEALPVLPDIKLLDVQYNEIKALVEQGQTVELEFDIRNWFKMGPVKYASVAAWIPGTTSPDETVIMSGHLDSFDAGTGAVDDGSGFSVAMEALRILASAGARPKRTIMALLFAAEENGILGAQAWLKNNPEKAAKIVLLLNRDGSPNAIVGANVPPAWYQDFFKITEPLRAADPAWPFELVENEYPRTKSERPGGTDASVFSMLGVPTLSLQTQTDYNYGRAWHTLNDVYSEVVPYTEHQKHSALATAVIAYGVANLDKTLPREGVYLPDGIYADFITAQGRILAVLDTVNAPLAAAQFIRINESPAPPEGPRPPPPGVPGLAPPTGPTTIGNFISLADGVAVGIINSDIQKAAGSVRLPKTINPVLKHDGPGVLGLRTENSFYFTLKKNSYFNRTYPAIGRLIAGIEVLKILRKDDEIKSIRIIRVGPAARDFKTDDESFKKLLETADK